MTAIGTAWADGAWIFESWASGAWSDVVKLDRRKFNEIVSIPRHGSELIKDGRATLVFQTFLDDVSARFNSNLLGPSVILIDYTVVTVPTASENANGSIIVSDETGGANHSDKRWR